MAAPGDVAMVRCGRVICWRLLWAAGLGLLSGCFGGTANPRYFPYYLPPGDIIQTHAKPAGHGYFANFDPHAVHLEVRPLESTNPVRTQHVLIATIYDEKGLPRRDRRVEWMIEGVGNIVEVDESGYLPGRGYKVDNKYAVTYTSYKEHRFSRGNANPNDDFVIRPGQTWCVISSAIEGDTHVTVYAPEIANWDAHKVFVTKHWVDAEWVLPGPAVNRAGIEHPITTHVFRHTDRQPLANYRVRYRILDGPPAVFLPNRTQEAVVISDLSGNATATLVQVAPQPGVNRIGVEIIRPPDPCSPSGAGIIIGQGETSKQWLGPQVTLDLTGPPVAAVGQEIPYTITVANTGQIETQAITVRDTLPAGTQLVRSTPPASIEGNQLIWTLGTLPGGKTYSLQAVLRTGTIGSITNCASMTTLEGYRDEKCVTTNVTAPQQAQLSLAMPEPPSVAVGTPVTLQITATNMGNGPATGVLLSASFDKALEHQTRANPVELPLGTLAPGESRPIPLVLTPTQAGRFSVRVTATADGNLKAEAQAAVAVLASRLSINMNGPKARYVDQAVAFDITVANQGDVGLNNVLVRDQLPPELEFMSATELGQFINGQVVWNVGALPPKGQKVVQVTARCKQLAPRAVNTAVVTAEPNLQEQAEAVLEIRGLPAFSLEVTKLGDPVLVGGKVVYKIVVTNTGSLPANQIQITANVPKEMTVGTTDGPSKARIEGNRVIYPPVDGLQSRQAFTYTIEAAAQQPGDVRFQAELRATGLTEPVSKQESTNIYPPPNGNGAAPTPGNTPPGPMPVPPR